jgi:hypothetical protein
LLIRKDSLGNHFKSLLKFFPEQYVDGQSRIEVNNFMSISNQFSGDIQLADWEENLEMGWLIANGNVVERYYEKKHGIKEKSYANAAVECRYVEKEVCTYYYEDNPLYEEGIGWEQQNVVECHFYIVPECSEINDGGPGWAGGGGSGSGPTGPVPGGGSGSGTGGLPYIPTDEELIDEWEDQIDATQLNPCIKDVLIDLKSLTTGVGNIVSQFAGDTPGYNWVVKSGAISGANATTNPRYNRSNQTVTTTFSNSSFGSATDLSIARTILHESVHAFLVVQMSNITSYDVFYKEYPMLMEDFMDIEVPLNQAQHHEMIRFYVDRIGVSLKEYGEMNGYNLPIQFYNDLAWGGLMDIPTEFDSHRLPTAYGESAWFKVLNQDRSVRDRIRNVVNVEQNGKDVNGNTKPQKGNDSGC